MDKNQIISGGISAFLAVLITLGGVKVTDPNVYVCEDREIAMECEELTAYYGLPNGKCVNSNLGNKLCRSGWTDEYSDFSPKEETEEETKENVIIKANDKIWTCKTNNKEISSYTHCNSGGYTGYIGELI